MPGCVVRGMGGGETGAGGAGADEAGASEPTSCECLANQFVVRHVLPFARKAARVGAETTAPWLAAELEACRCFVETDAACMKSFNAD